MQARLKTSLSTILGAITVVAAVLGVAATPVEARPAHHHHYQRQATSYRVARHFAASGSRRRYRSVPVATANAVAASQPAFSGGGSDIVSEARRWLGGNPTRRSSLWCAAFMNFVLERTGHPGSGSDMARSFASYGRRVSGPQVGAIAVMSRRGGGHVGVVSGFDPAGNPILISGNNGHRVREASYARGRIYAYVMP
ncbi:MAG TPA: TIGR02594 family protein [Xanthobacteraceae bacterium]